MQRCPCCEREFKNLTDYPVILVRAFKKLPISKKRFPVTKIEPFFDVDVGMGEISNRVPRKVVTLLKGRNQYERVEYHGREWRHCGYDCYDRITTRQAPVIEKLTPLLTGLESSIGKEFQIRKTLSKFKRGFDEQEPFQYAFEIPNAAGYYYFIFIESDKSQEDSREADLEVMQTSPHLIKYCTLAHIVYEGRLKK